MTTSLKRCLIIDDDESFRQLITRYINLLYPDVIVEEYDPAVSGPPPVDFDWSGCDLIILDYLLNSSLTGLDLLNEWKKNKYMPPVIMLTGAGNEDVAVRAMKTGVQDYLRKQNLSKEKLKESINEALTHYAAEREREASHNQNNQSFNKALFYQKLEQAAAELNASQVFVLIELDRFTEIGDQGGIILQDNLVTHIARTVHEAMSADGQQAALTRMSDTTVGLLYDPAKDRTLAADLEALQIHLNEQPYDADGTPVTITVSMAAIPLTAEADKANTIIHTARELCHELSHAGGNRYTIHTPEQADTAAGDNTPRDNQTAAVQESRPDSSPAPRPASRRPAPDSATAPPSEEELLEMTLEMPAEKAQDQQTADEENASEEFDILEAFRDNRLLQYYQPIMPLSDSANQQKSEYYTSRIRMVDTEGSIISAAQIMAKLRSSRNQKLLDRWVIRKAIGRIVSFHNNKQTSPVFVIRLSEESIADASLFNWLQNKLMRSVGQLNLGNSLYIEVSAETYLALERQVEALFKFLRQSYGFRFALSSFENVEQLNACLEKGRFDMYLVSQELLSGLQSQQSDSTAIPPQVSSIKQRGGVLVATFIETAAALTQAINCGADFALGYFIGEPIESIGEVSQIESFEIT